MNPLDQREATLIVQNNIHSIFSLSIKTILEKSCFQETIDEYSPDVVNFLNILDHIIYFCLKGTGAIFTNKIQNHPWKLFYHGCKIIPNNCIDTISEIKTIRNNYAKVRALIKMALIEKRLQLYISTAFNDLQMNRKYYSPDSIILSSRFSNILNELLGLNAVDFSFDLKVDMDHNGFNPLDYSAYLKYYQSPESVLDDLKECHGNVPESDDSHYCHWREKYDLMFEKAKKDSKQKGYLEEVLQNKETLLEAALNRNEIISKELKIMEDSVTDLQVQLALIHEQYSKELERLGGTSSTLLIPSINRIIGSRADLTSTRHKLANQLSEIDTIIPSEPHNLNGHIESSMQQSLMSNYSNATSSQLEQTLNHGNNQIGQSIRQEMNESTTSSTTSSNKMKVKNQKISSKTKRYYSPVSSTSFNSIRADTSFYNTHNNQMSPIVDSDPCQQSVETPKKTITTNANQSNLETFLRLTSPSNNDNNQLFCQSLSMIHNNQRTNANIEESKQLRKIIGKANMSPLIREHRHSVAFLDMNRRFDYDDNYDTLSLEELNFSSFNSSIATPSTANHTNNHDNSFLLQDHFIDDDSDQYNQYQEDALASPDTNYSNGQSHKVRRPTPPNSHSTIRFHPVNDPDNYYTVTHLHESYEVTRPIDNNIVNNTTIVENTASLMTRHRPDAHLIGINHPDHPSNNHLIHTPLANGVLQDPPEVIRNPPIITGEVPDSLQPNISHIDNSSLSQHRHRSPRSNNRHHNNHNTLSQDADMKDENNNELDEYSDFPNDLVN